MIWLLLNLLMAAPFFALWVGVPLWLVFKHPGRGPRAASGLARSHRDEPAEPELVLVPDAGKHPSPGVSKSFQKSCTQN